MPVFELALKRMKEFAGEDDLLDMYAGVGSIGLSLALKAVDLVESDPATAAMAEINAKASSLKSERDSSGIGENIRLHNQRQACHF